MSTNSPLVVRRLASLVESRGGEMMDSPVLGNPNIASKGALTILTSGKKEVVERERPVLESVGTKFFYLGSVGSSAAMKLVLNLHILSVNAIFLETLSLATKLGVHPKAALNIWNSSIHKTYVSEQYGSKVIEGSFSTPLATIEVMQKDLSLAEQVAKEVNFPLLVGSAAGEIYTASAAKGWKDLDISALVKLYEALNQIKVAGPFDEDGKEGEGKMHEGKA